jgi:hypothetical protein
MTTQTVSEPPKVEEGLLKRTVNGARSVASRCWGATKTAVSACANALGWAYNRTAKPAFEFIERWVPCCANIRRAGIWYSIFLGLFGFLLGALLLAEAGYMTLVAIPLAIVIGLVTPFIVLFSPALWPAVAFDLVLLSVFFNFTDAVQVKFTPVLEGQPRKSFWKALAFQMWPGVATKLTGANYITGEVDEVVEAQPAPASA